MSLRERNRDGLAASIRSVALGVVLFVGVLAIVEGLLGDPGVLLSPTMYHLGGAALIALAVEWSLDGVAGLAGGDGT